jgi:hypothetical protein
MSHSNHVYVFNLPRVSLSQLTVTISSIYWPLLLFFAPLILRAMPSDAAGATPAELIRLPISMDIALHAMPPIAVLTEFLVVECKYQGNTATIGAPLITSLYAIWYSFWVEHCASQNGHCGRLLRFMSLLHANYSTLVPYPFLEVPLDRRIVIYVAATFLGILSFRALNHLHPQL